MHFDLGRKLYFFEVLLLLSTFELDFLPRCTRHCPPTHGQESATAAQISLHLDRGSTCWGFAVCRHSHRPRSISRTVEIVTWLLQQATLCTKKTIGILLIFPEDLGGHEQDAPATIWCDTHLRNLDGASEVQRGAAFLWQIASTVPPTGGCVHKPRLGKIPDGSRVAQALQSGSTASL